MDVISFGWLIGTGLIIGIRERFDDEEEK